ncbi:MAG: methyltransferase domain-containing protein [Arenicellales bacterium]|nr:methyltransferase domain-containing protein [Arenicellales bacterium]
MNPRVNVSTNELNPTKRFSDRVKFYVRYRPGYPEQVLDVLEQECGFNPNSVVADIGSGTGILSKLFLKNKNTVYGVEPNPDMRKAGERYLQEFSNFISVEGTAENTNLTDNGIDFITAGQAFHWFDVEKCKAEFRRILTDKGWLVLLWNDRLTQASPFLIAYEQLLHTHGTDYDKVQHRTINRELVRPVFVNNEFMSRTFENNQILDYPSLEGRLLSSSYVPNRNHPNYQPMIEALRGVFDKHQSNGEVRFEYATKMFYGRL